LMIEIFRARKKRGATVFGALVSFVLLAVIAAPSALAVHDLNFQLDGDIVSSPAGNVGGGTQALDWQDLFGTSGQELALPAGFTASGFERDFNSTAGGAFLTNDSSTFSTGSKDTLPISGWQCNLDNNVNSKIDVMNAYAAAYTNPANSHEIIYFALERNTNTGDANVAFWFLQSDVGCTSTGPSVTFSGEHLDGDLLIVSAFTKGGTVSTIDVYRWNRSTGTCPSGPNCVVNPPGVPGSLGTSPVAHGVDCRSANTPVGDPACAAANTTANGVGGTIATPWPTSNFKDGVDHKLRTGEFFEGGVDLTAKGLGGRCFNTFLGDTRSSQSLTATLFDFARGTLGECSVTMTTDPSVDSIVIGSDTVVTDTATVVGAASGGGTAPTPTGSVTFALCGPSELTTNGVADADGVCEDSNGTQVGSAVDVAESVPGTATATSADANAQDPAIITGVGKYCFRATFTAAADDNNYPGQVAETGNLAAECFTVTGTAVFTTAQNWLPNDSATITGPGQVSGTATFTLYDNGDCTGTVVYGPEDVPVSGDGTVGVEVSTSNVSTFVVDADNNTGTYSWGVSYVDDVFSSPDPSCTEVSTLSITN
jgi:hypothetical protein